MDDTRQRILEATYACVARWGLAKTTIEDAAREASVSRATIYRSFPGVATSSWMRSWRGDRRVLRPPLEQVQGRRQPRRGDGAGDHVRPPGDRRARCAAADHADRAGEALPALTFESNRIRQGIAEFLVPYLRQRGVAAGVDIPEAADFLARMLLSYMSSPGRWDLDDPVQVAQLVRSELLPGVLGGSEALRGPAHRAADRGRPASLTMRQNPS